MEVEVGEMVLELAVGDMLQVGECHLTVISIETSEVTFRIEDVDTKTGKSASYLSRVPLQTLAGTVPLPNRPR